MASFRHSAKRSHHHRRGLGWSARRVEDPGLPGDQASHRSGFYRSEEFSAK